MSTATRRLENDAKYMDKKLLLVDIADSQIGQIDKLEAHLNHGQLHRAFTAIIKNDDACVLVTKRSSYKLLWPNFWDLSFSSHPWVGEDLSSACQRRAFEELGASISGFQKLFAYKYQIRFNQLYSEHEFNHILLANFNGHIKLNSEENSDYQWIKIADLATWLSKNSKIVAPWVNLAFNQEKKNKLNLNLFSL
jgi:isopentenyl-diphosphate Delta-isomerase